MGNVLYEVGFQFELIVFVPLVMLIVIPFIPKFEKVKYGRTTPVGIKIMLAVMWCFVLFVTILVGIHQINMYNAVTGAYKNGEYEIVEGYVENFDPMPPEGHKSESFEINGVFFSYSDYVVMTGYHNTKAKGGVVTGDGQYLKVGYIYYDDSHGNVIVYIEEIPDPQ